MLFLHKINFKELCWLRLLTSDHKRNIIFQMRCRAPVATSSAKAPPRGQVFHLSIRYICAVPPLP